MVCLRCDNEEFSTAESDIEQEYKGKLLKVKTPASICTKCGWVTVSMEQADELVKRTQDLWSGSQSSGRVGFASLRCGRLGFGVVGQEVVWFGPFGRYGLVRQAGA